MSRKAMIGLGLLGIILVVFPLQANPYIIQVAITWITFAMLGLGFAFSMRVGLPRIDVVTWWSVGGVATALLMKSGLNFFLAAPIAGIISMILGWVVFSIVIPRGVVIFFTLSIIFTFAAPGLIKFVFMLPFLRGAGGTVPAVELGPMEFVLKRDLYYLGLCFLGLNLAAFHLLFSSKIGTAWNAINSSFKLARSVGVDVIKYQVANMVIGTFFISLAGSYLIAYSHAAPPLIFNLKAGGMVMMYAFIGGLSHTFSGPLLGAFLLTFFPEYLRIADEYEPIITSAVAILIIIFMPGGILGWIDMKVQPWLRLHKWYAFFSRSRSKETPETLR